MQKLKDKHITRFWTLLFFLLLLVFWRFYYLNHLLQKEQMQLFLLTADFLKEHLAKQGGLALYLDGFLNQFFLNSWVASFLLAGLLTAFASGIQKTLKTVFGSGTYLFAFLPAIAYHFLLFDFYYKSAGLVSITLSLWLLVFYLNFKKAQIRFYVGLLLIAASYWLLGGGFLVFTLSAIVIEIFLRFRQNERIVANRFLWVPVVMYLFAAILIPLLACWFLLTDHLLSAYFSRAFYRFSFLLPFPVILLLLSVPALLVFHGCIPRKPIMKLNPVFGIVLIVALTVGSIFLPDFEEEREMKYDNLVRNQSWEEIIRLAEHEQPAGPQGKLALSLALAQTGKMSELLFHFDPHPNDFFIPFDIKGQAPMIAAEPYFYLGLTNFSKMFSIETIESTPDESRPVRSMLRYAESCLVDGDYAVAERYLWYLERTLFYQKKSNEIGNLLSDEKVESHPLYGKLRRQRVHDDFYYNYERIDAALIALLRSDPHNRAAYEYLMSWYLLQKDFDEFLKYLPLANTMGYARPPLVFQEAVAYILTLLDEVPEGLQQFPVSGAVQQNLQSYAEAFQQGGGTNSAEMKRRFGNTYWYYVHFTNTENE